MSESYLEAFKKNTKIIKVKDRYRCECRLGLWSVDAPTKKAALLEGNHYFFQYYGDGEYNS